MKQILSIYCKSLPLEVVFPFSVEIYSVVIFLLMLDRDNLLLFWRVGEKLKDLIFGSSKQNVYFFFLLQTNTSSIDLTLTICHVLLSKGSANKCAQYCIKIFCDTKNLVFENFIKFKIAKII